MQRARSVCEEDAQDAVQEAVARFLRATLRHPDKADAWLLTTVRNLCADRRRERAKLVALDDYDEQVSVPDGWDAVAARAEVGRLRVAVATWNHLDRLVVGALAERAEQDDAGTAARHVAARLGMSYPAARSKVTRVRHELHEALGHDGTAGVFVLWLRWRLRWRNRITRAALPVAALAPLAVVLGVAVITAPSAPRVLPGTERRTPLAFTSTVSTATSRVISPVSTVRSVAGSHTVRVREPMRAAPGDGGVAPAPPRRLRRVSVPGDRYYTANGRTLVDEVVACVQYGVSVSAEGIGCRSPE